MGRYFSSWLFFSLGALLCWGVFGFFSKVGAAQLSPMQLQLVFSAGILITTLPVWPGSGFSAGSDKLGLLYATLTGLLSVVANLAVFSALQNGAASIIQPATGLYPAVTVILASIVLKERINGIQALGVALALVALWLLSL